MKLASPPKTAKPVVKIESPPKTAKPVVKIESPPKTAKPMVKSRCLSPKISKGKKSPKKMKVDEKNKKEKTLEHPVADSAKSSKSDTSQKAKSASIQDLEEEVVSKTVKEEENAKIKKVKEVLKKKPPVEKAVKTTTLLGPMKKVSFGDETFCLGFAEKNGNSNFYAKCELKNGSCPTDFDSQTCSLAPIHLSDVLHKAVLTKL